MAGFISFCLSTSQFGGTVVGAFMSKHYCRVVSGDIIHRVLYVKMCILSLNVGGVIRFNICPALLFFFLFIILNQLT